MLKTVQIGMNRSVKNILGSILLISTNSYDVAMFQTIF